LSNTFANGGLPASFLRGTPGYWNGWLPETGFSLGPNQASQSYILTLIFFFSAPDRIRICGLRFRRARVN